MIKNESEYKYSQEWAEKFKRSISALDKDEEGKRNNLHKWESNRSVLRYHLEELEREIAEYERLIHCDCREPIEIKVNNFNQLPDVLIKARMAAKISYEELAEIIGIDSEKIKQFEENGYQYASFLELVEVSTALGVEFKIAVMQVDFEEVEIGRKIAAKRQNRKEKMLSTQIIDQ
jgi:transcriptional regulator with XRE-family HTH domain